MSDAMKSGVAISVEPADDSGLRYAAGAGVSAGGAAALAQQPV